MHHSRQLHVRRQWESTVESELSRISEEQFRANRFALVSRLADDLAHEIKNPLNAIVINLEVLRTRVARADADGALTRVAVIDEEVRRLHLLIERLLQLIRPERDEACNLPVDSALDELLPLLDAQARLARNRLRVDCAAAVFIAVRRDVFKFAMLNLYIAVHEQLGEGGGCMVIECDTDVSRVTLRIVAEPETEARGGSTGDGLAGSVEFAAALLAPAGGRIDRAAAGVTITLPRAASM
jgi:two-component system, NtrC family, sensor kinase